jgi:hypothetical protein
LPLLALLLAPLAEGSAGGPFPPGPGEATWQFRVLLDDREIGFHRFEVSESDGVERVDIEARFEVEVLFFTAYRYAHDNLETWRGDCLARIESSTDDNGETFAVRGADEGDAFTVQRQDGQDALDTDCMRTFAYWNPRILEADRLLNAQTGEVKEITVERVGVTPFEVDGVPVSSEEYLLTMEDGAIRLWYEQGSGQWLGLETRARGDRTLRYVPELLPQPPRERAPVAGVAGPDASGRLSTP